jgi:BirA family biotin operon repressor/biotin-[acetyl-CoA-carboxylase] ligase
MVESIPLEIVDEIGSTSEALRVRAACPGPEAALLARRQSGGRGRLGRPWQSIDGNLHLSVLLRPQSLRWPGHWSILAAVALADTVRPHVPAGTLRLKWPNDLLLDGGKLAGILLEAGVASGPWLVIGFGVNLAGAPLGLDRPVASLASAAPAPAPEAFAGRLLQALQRWRARYASEGFAPMRAAWLAAAHAPGERIVVGMGGQRVHGAFHGLGHDGTLLLDGPGGKLAITAGELE